jgi:dipeptidyl aminopeptidase/acylaminoacyl peptidase
LTDNGAYNAESTVSPDGSKIIFTSTRDGDIELYVMDIDGRNVRRLTNRVGYDGGAFFSPDGSGIVWRAAYPVTAKDTADYQGLLAARLVGPPGPRYSWLTRRREPAPGHQTGRRQLRAVLSPGWEAYHLFVELPEPPERRV